MLRENITAVKGLGKPRKKSNLLRYLSKNLRLNAIKYAVDKEIIIIIKTASINETGSYPKECEAEEMTIKYEKGNSGAKVVPDGT